MATVGIVNGLTDIEAMALGFLDYAMNNTFDHPIIDEETYTMAMTNLTDPEEGCLRLIHTCRAAQAGKDLFSTRPDPTVDEACSNASVTCGMLLIQGMKEVSPVSANPFVLCDLLTRRVF